MLKLIRTTNSPHKLGSVRVCKEHAHRPFLGYRPRSSGYEWITYGEFGSMVDSARALLHRSGIGKGDTVRTDTVYRGCLCPWGIGKARSQIQPQWAAMGDLIDIAHGTIA